MKAVLRLPKSKQPKRTIKIYGRETNKSKTEIFYDKMRKWYWVK